MINWKDGDVFEFAKKDGGTIQKVVLKAFKKYAAVIALYPNEQYEYEHEVYSDQLMHACVAKIGTVPARDFEDADYVCNIGPVAYDKLVDHVAIALGLYAKQLGVTIPVQPEPEMQTSIFQYVLLLYLQYFLLFDIVHHVNLNLLVHFLNNSLNLLYLDKMYLLIFFLCIYPVSAL